MARYYIGEDVHSNSIEMAIINRRKIAKRYTFPTSIQAAPHVLDSIGTVPAPWMNRYRL